MGVLSFVSFVVCLPNEETNNVGNNNSVNNIEPEDEDDNDGGISGRVWPEGRGVILSKKLFNQFANIGEHLEISFSYDAVSQTLVFFALAIGL